MTATLTKAFPGVKSATTNYGEAGWADFEANGPDMWPSSESLEHDEDWEQFLGMVENGEISYY